MKGKDPSKKSIKPLIMKLDFNNKIETTKKIQSQNKIENPKKTNNSNNFDLNEIKKRFNIDENNNSLRHVKKTIGNILNKG